jgi:hypothetical protein
MPASAAALTKVAVPSFTLAGNDAWHPDSLIEGIRAQRYGAIVLNRMARDLNDWEWTTLWITAAKEDILRHYRLAEVVVVSQGWRFLEPERYIYVPVGADPAGATPPVTGAATPGSSSHQAPPAPPEG